MCDSKKEKKNIGSEQMSKTLSLSRLHVEEIDAKIIQVKKIILEGIALDGFILQSLFVMQGGATGSGDMTSQIAELQRLLALLNQKVNALTNNVTSITNTLNVINPKVTEDNLFINFLKTQITIVNPP
jgi:hypothetical protein